MEDKPDRFGKFSEIMLSIHRGIEIAIVKKYCFKEEDCELHINQMSLFEHYASSHNQGYVQYSLRCEKNSEDQELSDFLIICVNAKQEPVLPDSSLIDFISRQINEKWKEKIKKCFLRKDMKVEIHHQITVNDTVQTIHYFVSGIQIFKIIYPYMTVGSLLAEVSIV